jgi:type II secretory pathway predicted ATPase ExeA
LLDSKLSEKQFKVLVLTHSSLSGSDLLRALSLVLEIRPKFRRSDNVAAITEAWASLGSRWPVLIVEEAQNLSAAALEELRLLSCAKLDKVPFSLVLVGDNGLLARCQARGSCAAAQPAGILPAAEAAQRSAKPPICRTRLA